ncbi:hypothetical protein K8089_10070 [Aequorivita sp. F47161]|uniref:DUF4365 domain-containing protein n=1 Tax=Aequorivita vitellina TaxID=2874475 RepID=A0A9X1QZD7_9FLAO|nr:hypothetical protein [Aequorivita vitellina]MCG2419369.1 hypothetical protein [Aequorivita vitellina]
MDNKPIEELGESFIKSRLLKFDFDTHSELSYDKDGTDLIITQKVDNTTLSYIKIQSKARKLNKSTSVRIPKSYVNENFVLFIYIIDHEKKEYLYCFFEDDYTIFKEKENEYVLNISYSTFAKKLSNHTFDKSKADRLKALFEKFKKKSFTTLIIDGVFLKESILETNKFYSEYWKRKLKKPKLHEIVKSIIIKYNRFEQNQNDIACYLYISNHNDLVNVLDIDNKQNSFLVNNKISVKIFVSYSNELVCFQIMDDINRFKKSNNLILVANDIAYERFLKDLENEDKEILIMRLKINERPNEMFVNYKWGDISYPIGLSMGLEPFEL